MALKRVVRLCMFLGADLFTSCLTTPIRVALKWFVQNNRLLSDFNPELVDKLPGEWLLRGGDRKRSPLFCHIPC